MSWPAGGSCYQVVQTVWCVCGKQPVPPPSMTASQIVLAYAVRRPRKQMQMVSSDLSYAHTSLWVRWHPSPLCATVENLTSF